MNENVKITCVCEQGYDKGILKKTIENNVFTIYGNIHKNSHIVIRYHGELIDKIDYKKYNNNLYISYFFDNNEEKKEIITLAKCDKCIGENYCGMISLEEHNTINFRFYIKDEPDRSSTTKIEPDNFCLEIKKDPLIDILQKYGVEENTNLPTIQKNSELQIKKIISNIKSFFLSALTKMGII